MGIEIYEPNKTVRLGLRIWPVMIEEAYRARELTWRLFMRNLLARYKQAVLGFLWALIMPFIAIGTFIFLNKSGVMNISSTDVPYPLFALIGLTVWQLFSTGITCGAQSLVASGGMISKINFPLESLVFSSIAQSVFEFLVKLILLAVFFMAYRFIPPVVALFFPVLLLPIFFLTLGCSFILSLVNGVVRDVANIVSLLVTFFMFATPVLYPAKDEASAFFKWNPLNYLVNAPRDILIHGKISHPEGFIWSSLFAFAFFFFSWRIFFIAKTKIPERI